MEECVTYSMANWTEKCYNLITCDRGIFSTQGNKLTIYHLIFIVPLAIITGPANLLTIIALARKKKSRGVSGFSIFATSLAFTDLSVGIVCIPMTVLQYTQSWLLGDISCVVFKIVDYGFGSVSVFLMTAMGFDRFKCVSSPLSYRSNFRVRRIVIQSIVLWISGISVWIPGFVTLFVQQGSFIENGFCAVRDYRNFSVVQAAIVYYIPLIVTVIMYTKLGFSLRQRFHSDVLRDCGKPIVCSLSGTYCHTEQSDWAAELVSNNDSKKWFRRTDNIKSSLDSTVNSKQTINVTTISKTTSFKRNASSYSHISSQNQQCIKISLLVVIVFIICWGPFCVLWPVHQTCKECLNLHIYNVLSLVPYVNSAVNPFIYLFSSHQMRSYIKTRLLKLCAKKGS